MPMATDDPSIHNACEFFRRIHPDQYPYDENRGRRRISSAAFKAYEASGDLGSVIAGLGLAPVAHCLGDYPDHGLASIRAGGARSYDQAIVRAPIEADATKGIRENPAHALMVGEKRRKKICKKLAEAATLVQAPPKWA